MDDIETLRQQLSTLHQQLGDANSRIRQLEDQQRHTDLTPEMVPQYLLNDPVSRDLTCRGGTVRSTLFYLLEIIRRQRDEIREMRSPSFARCMAIGVGFRHHICAERLHDLEAFRAQARREIARRIAGDIADKLPLVEEIGTGAFGQPAMIIGTTVTSEELLDIIAGRKG